MGMINSLARRFGVRSTLAIALASVSGFALIGAAQAQPYAGAEAEDAATIAYDIPAQPLSSALLRFAEQSGLQVLFTQEELEGLRSRALHGRYAPADALARLLPPGAPRIEIVGDQIVRLDSIRPQYAGDADIAVGDDLVVTGTRIRGATPAGSNVLSLDRQAIDAAGRASVQDVLQTLPQNFSGSQNEATQLGSTDSRRNVAFGSTVDLRGLGADATLTLLNGRRLAPAGYGNFVDISVIPLAAVERIEILADGASATYGSDAVAGVVNVILRDDFDGAETSLRYGAATRGDPSDIGFSQLLGTDWGAGHVMAGYHYRARSRLSAADRDFAATSDLRPWGGSNFGSTFSNPGNITSIGGAPVVLAIPAGQDGMSLSESDLLAGVRNYRPATDSNSLLPEQVSHSIFAAIEQDLGDRLTLSGEILATRREAFSERFQLDATLIIPETNAYRQLNNLFPGQGDIVMSYNLGDDLGPSRFNTESNSLSATFALSYDLGGDWALDAGATYSRHVDSQLLGNLYDASIGLDAALASSDLATAFNPFADGSNTNPAILEGLTFDTLTENDSEIVTYSAKADGPLFALWGGNLRAAIGIERRREQFFLFMERRFASGTEYQPALEPGDRSTDALFGEIYAPLVGPENGVPFVRDLTLSLSVRHEAPSSYESSTTPKIGLRWALGESLALRGTWGESFKAPQFQQTLGAVGGTILSLPGAFDPLATNGSTGLLFLSGSNRDLRPERAENWTAGFDFTPDWGDGFALRATYFDIDFIDRIATPGNLLFAIANPTGFESVQFRNPSQALIDQYLGYADSVVGVAPPDGIELIFDSRLTNLASLRVRGADVSGEYVFELGGDTLTLFANASLLFEYRRQTGPGVAAINALDTMFNPIDLRGRFGLSYAAPDWSAALTGNYADSYQDTISSPHRDIDSLTTWDLRLARQWGDRDEGLLLAFNVQNLFDEDPPFANNPIGYGFDAQNASPLGRFASIELRRTW